MSEEVSGVAPVEQVQTPPVAREEVVEQRAQPTVDLSKLQEQIQNLNTALKQERETNKSLSQELKEKLDRSQDTIEKLKNVFTPQQQVTPKEEKQSLTLEQIEALMEKKEADRRAEEQKQSQIKAIKSEVSQLEKEWDGTDGKPKYEDKKVLQWQEDNNKLYLSPREAFMEMERNSIIEFEIQKRMKNKPNVQNVETPQGVQHNSTPQGNIPKTPQELRNAVLEAMDIASNN